MRGIILAMRALCEAGAARDGDVKASCEALLRRVDWEAALSDDPAGDPPPAVTRQRLEEACALSGEPNSPERALADAVAAAGPGLRWKEMYAEYDDEPDMAAFRRVYAYTLLVGPEAPLRSDRVKVGVTLQGPDALYPAHAHRAAELYAVVGGTADWRRGSEPWTRRPPGDFVVHPSGVRHAIQTNAEPLLAFVAWLSEIDSRVVIVRG